MKVCSQDKSLLNNISVLLILIVGAVLRIMVINKEIWFDEALSIYVVRQSPPELFNFIIKSWEMQLPFYYLILKVLLFFSSSYICFRIFSLICGMLVIYMTYKLGELIFDRRVGLVSCLLVACSEMFIYYSVEIRVYSLWALLSVLSIYFFIKLTKNPSRLNTILFLIFTVLSIYAHYFGVFLPLAESLYFLLNRKSLRLTFKPWLKMLSCILILLIPEILYVIIKLQRTVLLSYFLTLRLTREDVFLLFKEYSNHAFIFLVFAFCLICALIKQSKGISFKNLWRDTRVNSILVCFVFPVVVVLVFSLGKYPLFKEQRFFLPFFIFYYFAISWSCFLCPAKVKNWAVAVIILLVFSNALRWCVFVRNRPYFDSKKVAGLLKPALENNDIVAVFNMPRFLPVFNLLDRPIKIIARPETINQRYLLRSFVPQGEEELITDPSTITNKRRLWLIMDKYETRLAYWLDKNTHLRLVRQEDIAGVEVRVYNINN